MLLDWKARLERAQGGRLTATMNVIGYAELEVAAKALLATSVSQSPLDQVIPPKDKIHKNALSSKVETLLTMGAAKSNEMAHVLTTSAQLDPDFPNRLRNGFVQKYDELRSKGTKGDKLFLDLYAWASGDDGEVRQAAGLCVLTHLFVICDLFEK
jgi:hypothetical protein